MPPIRHGTASWPGAVAIESCSYTISHGISPGTIQLRLQPQPLAPAMWGDLVISDGVGTITVPDCKVDDVKVDQDSNGFVWSLQISDRRWKWRDLGSISGAYNQLDNHGKLIPWTIRSPKELAELCLKAMGEKRYSIDMPPGLTRAQGVVHANQNPEWIGVIPTTGTNPPVNWVNETPAVALAQICETFGRRVIYRWSDDSVLITIPGKGDTLPAGSVSRRSPSLKNPQTPTGAAIYGAPTRYQARLAFEAVGEEWDGSFRRIDDLSYTPQGTGKPQISKATAATTASNTFAVWIGAASGDPPTTGALFETTTNNATTACSNLATAINASTDPRVQGIVKASSSGTALTVTGVKEGVPFQFWARPNGSITGTVSFVSEMTQAPLPSLATWKFSIPPLFANVIRGPGSSTDRLRYEDALQLAQKTVHRYFRLRDKDVSGRGPILIPNYGRLKRRQQVILTPTQVEQVTPQPLDARLVDALGRPFLENFYNGYSRDKPAVAYGSVATNRAMGTMKAWWLPAAAKQNSLPSDRIWMDFTVDPEQQLVIFNAPIYRTEGASFLPAEPVVQTGVLIRNAKSNAIECYVAQQRFPGARSDVNFMVRRYDDVQRNVIGDYNDAHKLTGVRDLELDAKIRAKYYLIGLSAQFITQAADFQEYNGIEMIDLDGAISQVTWEVGPNGATTQASRNSEHSIYVPPYPARRRAEFLRPAQQAALAANANPPRQGPAMTNPNFQG